MFSLSQCVYEDGLKKGIDALIRNNIREGIPKERTMATIREFFALSEEKAEEYFAMAVQKEECNE